MIPTLVFPDNGPAGFHQSNMFFSLSLMTAPVVISPITRQPIPPDNIAADIVPSILAEILLFTFRSRDIFGFLILPLMTAACL